MKVHLCGMLCAMLLLGAGCQTPAERTSERAVVDYHLGDFSFAEQELQPLAQKTDENFVLNNDRLGSAALANYDLETAERAFLGAYEVINSVGVNDGGRSLGAAVLAERIKVWKGEPFERAMVNFYLGVIYYMRHDYNNARGAFENALFKLREYPDSAARSDNYVERESNFAPGYIMLARCYQRLGRADDAQKTFDKAIALHASMRGLADYQRNLESNVLLVVDYGFGPIKATSRDGAIVGFVPTPARGGAIPLPHVRVDGQPYDVRDVAHAPLDMLQVAQERVWQDIDTIRAVKSAVGLGLIAGGAAYGAIDRDANPYIALGLIAGGALLRASSQADVRQWAMLPRTTFLLPLKLPPGKHNITVLFPAVPGLQQEWDGLDVSAEGEATYYYRILRTSQEPNTWPPAPIAAAQGK